MTYREYLEKYFPNTDIDKETLSDSSPFDIGVSYTMMAIKEVVKKYPAR